MNRRYFFLGALGAGAVSAQSSRAASDRVNIAMVGLGGRGRHLTPVVAQLPNTAVTWLVEVDQQNLERGMATLGKLNVPRPQTTNDIRRVLEDKNFNAVVITTPDHWHVPAALLACEAGKDVYVEKPLSHNLREGRLLVEAARYHNRIVQVGTQARSRPTTIRAIDYVRSGKLGRVLAAKAWNLQMRDDIGSKPDGPVPPGVDYDTWLGPVPWIPFNKNRFHYKWHWHWHFGTGDIGNDGAHQIDQARWALGESYPLTVNGSARKLYFGDDQQTPDTMTMTFEFARKTLIWEMRIWNPYGGTDQVENGMAVYGSDGRLEIGAYGGRWGYKVFDRTGKLVTQEVEPGGDSGLHQRNFVDCIRSRKMPNADVGEGHLTATLCHLGNIVARTGRNLKFDAESESIPTDPEANGMIRRTYRRHWSTPKNL